MRKLVVIVACLLACSGFALADVYSFTFVGPTIAASGWLDLTGFIATTGSASFQWSSPPPGGGPYVAPLLPGSGTSPSGKFWYDSSLAPGAYGILFVAGSGQEFNIWLDTAYTGSIFASGPDYIPPGVGGWGEKGTFTLSAAVPDGGVTLILLGGVLVGLETLRRRLRA